MWKCPKCGRAFKTQNQQHYCGEKPKTIEAYILEQDPKVQPYLTKVREAIHRAIPDAEETISWSMPTFREGRNLIHFAASAKHMGIYPGSDAVEAFKEELQPFQTSKGTVRIPYQEPMPLQLIADIAKWCEAAAAGEKK